MAACLLAGCAQETAKPVAGPALAQPEVTVYGTAWCGYCKNARNWLTLHQVRFQDVDIEQDAKGMQQFRALGGQGVPLLKVGKDVIRGFDAESFLIAWQANGGGVVPVN